MQGIGNQNDNLYLTMKLFLLIWKKFEFLV